MMSKRFMSLSMLLTSAAFAATFAAGCSSSGGGKSVTPTPVASIGFFAGQVTATYNVNTALDIGANLNDSLHGSAAGCGITLDNAGDVGCILEIITVTTASSGFGHMTVPTNGYTLSYEIMETLEPNWVNGTHDYALGNGSLVEIVYNLVQNSAGNNVQDPNGLCEFTAAEGPVRCEGVFASTNGSFTLTGLPTNGPDLDGATFGWTQTINSWFNLSTTDTGALTGGAGTITNGNLDSGCFSAGGC